MVLASLAPGKEYESAEYLASLKKMWPTKAELDSPTGYVLNGMMQSIAGEPVYEPFQQYTNSRHLSVVFNLFVFCQIFNMICARKINDEFNIFQHVMGNVTFIAVWLVIVVVQCLVTQFSGKFVKIHDKGLTGWQWVFCLVGGSFSFLVNFILKFIPDHICIVLGDEDQQDIETARAEYMNLRKTRELSSSVRQGNFIHNKKTNV